MQKSSNTRKRCGMSCKERYHTMSFPHGSITENYFTFQVSLVVRSTLDVFDRFTSKAYVSILTPSAGLTILYSQF